MNQHTSTTDECPICYNNEPNRPKTKLECGHYFCVECINKWMNSIISKEQIITCPVCRGVQDISVNRGSEFKLINDNFEEMRFNKHNELEDDTYQDISTLSIYNHKMEPHDCRLGKCHEYSKFNIDRFITINYKEIRYQLNKNDIPCTMITYFDKPINQYCTKMIYELNIGNKGKKYLITINARSLILFKYREYYPLLRKSFKGLDGKEHDFYDAIIFKDKKSLYYNSNLFDINTLCKSYENSDDKKYMMFLNSMKIIDIDYFISKLMIENNCLNILLNTNILSIIYDYNLTFEEFRDIEYFSYFKYGYDLQTIANIVFIFKLYNILHLFDKKHLLFLFNTGNTECNCEVCSKSRYSFENVNKLVEERWNEMKFRFAEYKKKIFSNQSNISKGKQNNIILPVS